MTKVFLCWCVVTIMTVVSACGGAGELLDARPGEGGSGPPARPTSPQSAAEALVAAQRTLRRHDSGRFTRTVTQRGPKGHKTVVWSTTGRHDIPHGRSRGTTTLSDAAGDDDPLRLRFVSDGERRFVQEPGWRCWLTLSPDDLWQTLGGDFAPGTGRLTGEISGLLRAELTTIPSDSVEVFDALVPLPIAAGLVNLHRRTTDLDTPDSVAPVVVRVRVKSGRNVSWSFDGDDVLTAMNTFGVIENRETRRFLHRTEVRIELRAADTVPPIRLPPRSDRVRVGPETEDFDPNSCGGEIV